MAINILDDFSVFPYPRVARIEPSSLCNLNCIHCPTGTLPNTQRGNMSCEVFSRIIGELKVYNRPDVAVLYHSGEPFLNKNIFEMIKALKSIGIGYVKTVTNGMLINDEMIAKIIASGLDSIEFSLDGLSPEENNRIRKGGDYYQVSSTIKKLLSMKDGLSAAKPDVYVTNVQIPLQEDIEAGVKISTPKYILDDFADFEGKIKFKNTYMLKWPGFDCFDRYKLAEGPLSKEGKFSNYCDHLVQVINFRWNGDVVPCCYDIIGNYVAGNIMNEHLSEIWNNEKYKQLRQSISLGKYMLLCVNCNVLRPQLFVTKKIS